jgi:pimeloyl-ACP methyl ester carboxylesterase
MRWPPVPVSPPAATGQLPNVPTLLLAGDRDLSTPLPWPQAEVKHAHGGRLVIVHGAGHGVQLRGAAPPGRRIAERFLQGGR